MLLSQKIVMGMKLCKSALDLLAKVSGKIIAMGLTLIAIPIVVLTRLLRPFVLIRYGYFSSERIGHFVFDVAFYLSSRTGCADKRFSLDLFGMAQGAGK